MVMSKSCTRSALGWLLALVIVTVGTGLLCGCGFTREASRAVTGATRTETRPRALDSDGDDDRPGSREDPDSDEVLTFGHAASATRAAGMVAFVKSYYRAAAHGDGAAACAMLDPIAVEAMVERGRRSGVAGPGDTCARLLAPLFARRHRTLVGDLARFHLVEARIREGRGLLWLVLDGREVLLQLRPRGGSWWMEAPLEEDGP